MNFLVIGGTGFIASHIIDALLQEKHHVRVLDRTIKYKFDDPHGHVEYITGDYGDKATIRNALDGMEIVLHLASGTVPASSNADPIMDIRSNLIKTVTLLEEMKRANISRIIYFSSGGTVYGEPETELVKEDHPKEPMCSYGITKLAIEKYLLLFEQLHGLEPTILRPSNPFGPRQGHIGAQGAISTFADRIINEHPITIWGNGSVVRDYIYISDLVDACMAAINSQKTGTFNIGSGQGKNLLQIIKAIGSHSDHDPKITFEPARNFDIKKIVLDISKANEELNWHPKVDFEMGIKMHCDWFKQALN